MGNDAVACCSDDDCADTLSCAVQSDLQYSQCIDCTEDSFEAACPYWSGDFLTAAEATCKETCTSSKTTEVEVMTSSSSGCTNDCCEDSDCTASDESYCITESDGFYAQCVDCETFQTGCSYWSSDILSQAETSCGMTCGDVQCDTSNDAVACCSDDDCADTLSCAVQSDLQYSQCIDCTEDSFEAARPYWSGDFLTAAEATCKETCTSSKTTEVEVMTNFSSGCTNDCCEDSD